MSSLKHLTLISMELEKELINREGETDEVFEEFLNKNKLQTREKVDAIVFFSEQLAYRVEYFSKLEKEAKQTRKHFERSIESLKSYVVSNMDRLGTNELAGDAFRYILIDTPPSLVIDNELAIPNEYKTETIIIDIDKERIKKDLKAGFDVPGCRLVVGRTARKYMVKK